jgi:hypothetical protein
VRRHLIGSSDPSIAAEAKCPSASKAIESRMSHGENFEILKTKKKSFSQRDEEKVYKSRRTCSTQMM